MAKVALVGANSYIGQRLLTRLQQDGYDVYPIANNDVGAAGMAAMLSSCQAVVNCASVQRGRHLEDFLPTNVATVAAIADVLVQHPHIGYLQISTLAATRPQLSWYCRSKAAAEQLLRQHLQKYQRDHQHILPWTIVRVPAIYGPGDGQLSRLLAKLRRGLVPILGNPEQRMSMLHVDDLTQAVAAWLGNPAACQARVYGLDDGHVVGYDWGQIAQAAAPGSHWLIPIPNALLVGVAWLNLQLARLVGYAPLLTPGKVRELNAPDWVCDNAEFSAATGWQPQIDLTSGLQAMFAPAKF